MTDTVRVYKFYSATWGLDALTQCRLKMSTDRDINDPFEFLAAGKTKADRADAKRHRADLFRDTGLISFSRTWSEPLLWSHYADNHRGLSLGFDIPLQLCHSVVYTDERVQLPPRANEPMVYGEHIQFHASIKVTKYSAWHYEEEERVFPSIKGSICENDHYYRNFEDIGELKHVVIGAKYRSSKDKKLTKQLQNLGVEISTARLAFTNFSVILQDALNMQKTL